VNDSVLIDAMSWYLLDTKDDMRASRYGAYVIKHAKLGTGANGTAYLDYIALQVRHPVLFWTQHRQMREPVSHGMWLCAVCVSCFMFHVALSFVLWNVACVRRTRQRCMPRRCLFTLPTPLL